MADYEVLAPGGHENLINNVTERLDEKAYIDGYYAQLTAGAADSLTGRGDGVSASYLYRTTGGDADVADGTATVKSIHGLTVRWNQLISCNNSSSIKAGITATASASTNTITLSGNWAGITSEDRSFYGLFNTHSLSVTSGHKYLMHCTSTHARLYPYGTGISGTGTANYGSYIWTATAGGTVSLALMLYNDETAQTISETVRASVFDLTAMFGAGNEPSTVAEFEALYPDPYYPYDASSLLSVQMEGIETVGFNQWDEEWERGYWNANDGSPHASSSELRSKNAIPVLPSTTYFFRKGSESRGDMLFYDESDGFISARVQDNNATFTTPSNCRYIRFNLGSSYGTTYNNDICINLSWSGYRNGEYEPYWKSERTIPAATYFPNGMRSAGSVYDELTADEAIVRVGVVDLGTLDWAAGWGGFYVKPYGAIPAAYKDANTPMNMRCAKYETTSYANRADKTIYGANPNGQGTSNFIAIMDESYTTAEELKASLAGVILYYELATPTTQAIDPPLNLSYRVSDFGTERVMVPVNEQSAPPTMQVVYGLNVVDTVRRLPTEYISHDSFTQFRIALGAKLGVFIIETWDENDGRYEYTINDA